MENNQTENLPISNPIDSNIRTDWMAEVTFLLKDLWYPSESDEPIEWISFQTSIAPPLTTTDLVHCQGFVPELVVEEKEVENFWEPVITLEDWFGEDEKLQVGKFLELKQLMEDNLKDIQLFRVGQVEIELYLIGQFNTCEWVGLKTKVIET